VFELIVLEVAGGTIGSIMSFAYLMGEVNEAPVFQGRCGTIRSNLHVCTSMSLFGALQLDRSSIVTFTVHHVAEIALQAMQNSLHSMFACR